VVAALRIGTASVWLIFGVGYKLLGLVPRHRLIVASVLGQHWSGPATLLIGSAEAGMALWILSGLRPRLCAATQTVAIVAMNTLEWIFAHDLLVAPVAMLFANAALLAAGWYCALRTPAVRA
jgi:hypothetical protein